MTAARATVVPPASPARRSRLRIVRLCLAALSAVSAFPVHAADRIAADLHRWLLAGAP